MFMQISCRRDKDGNKEAPELPSSHRCTKCIATLGAISCERNPETN